MVKTRDKTTSSAIKALHGWIFTYGLPHGCKGRFKEYLNGMGIKHIQTSAYNAQSNRLVERGVRQVKDVLKKIGKTKKVSDDLLK